MFTASGLRVRFLKVMSLSLQTNVGRDMLIHIIHLNVDVLPEHHKSFLYGRCGKRVDITRWNGFVTLLKLGPTKSDVSSRLISRN